MQAGGAPFGSQIRLPRAALRLVVGAAPAPERAGALAAAAAADAARAVHSDMAARLQRAWQRGQVIRALPGVARPKACSKFAAA